MCIVLIFVYDYYGDDNVDEFICFGLVYKVFKN